MTASQLSTALELKRDTVYGLRREVEDLDHRLTLARSRLAAAEQDERTLQQRLMAARATQNGVGR